MTAREPGPVVGRAAWRVLVPGAVLAAAISYVSLRLDAEAPAVPGFVLGVPPQACTPSGLVDAAGSPVASPELIRMNTNSYVRALVCEPSRLDLTAEGTAARGVGARLSVHLGTEPLFDEPVDGSVELSLALERPGWLVIAFNNDLYEPPQDRNLVLRDVRLEPSPVGR